MLRPTDPGPKERRAKRLVYGDTTVPTHPEILSPAAEQALGALLVTDGLITSAQLLAVQQYSWQHKIDLRQALLKLRLVPPDQLAKLVNERVPLLVEAVDENLPVLAEDPEPALPQIATETAPESAGIV